MVEQTLAWLARYRRLTIRYERRVDIHQALLTLGYAFSPSITSPTREVMKGTLILQRQLRVSGSERCQDMVPGTVLAPAAIAAIDGLPRAEHGWQLTPRGPSLDDPENPRDHRAVIARRAPGPRFGGQHPGDAGPPGVGQVWQRGRHRLEGWFASGGIGTGAAGGMTPVGDRLVAPAKGGPGSVVRALRGRLAQGQEQATDLRERQRNQVGGPPFCVVWAVCRVTVSAACARRAKVIWRCHGVHFRTS